LYTLKLELVKVSSELNSMREIIKILQEKESTTQQPRQKPRIPEQDLDGKTATAEDPYEEFTYWTSRKKPTRRNYGHLKQEEFPIHVDRYNALRTLIEPQIVELHITHKTMTMKFNSEKRSKKYNGNCRKCRNKRKIIRVRSAIRTTKCDGFPIAGTCVATIAGTCVARLATLGGLPRMQYVLRLLPVCVDSRSRNGFPSCRLYPLVFHTICTRKS
jgi:hypothetical protein